MYNKLFLININIFLLSVTVNFNEQYLWYIINFIYLLFEFFNMQKMTSINSMFYKTQFGVKIY